MNLRLDIQGLRALAVVFVIIFHIQHLWLPGGFIGVDIFFVISGFLISKALIKQLDNKFFNYYEFLFGRVKRIAPAYFVMLLLCSYVAMVVLLTSDSETFLYQLRRSIFFTSNQLFATANDYFGAKSYENVLLHTWSLSIEMQFYMMLPLFMMFFPKSIYKWILVILALFFFAYTQYQIVVLNNKLDMYFSMLARSSEFVIGIAINFIPTSKKFTHRYKSLISIVALLSLSASCIFINEKSNFPGLLALPACIATALLIWIEDSKINAFLGSKPLAYVGKISYSLYLWHWPVLAFYRYYFMQYDLTGIEIILLLVVILILSIGSYFFIEEPFRKTNKMKYYFSLGVLCSMLSVTWYFGRLHYKKIQTTERSYTGFSSFNLKNHEEYHGYFLMGDTTIPDDKIVLLGDSHAMVMTGFFDVIGKKNSFNFSYCTINSVVPLEGINDTLIESPFKKKYHEAVPIANDLITKAKIIFIIKQWHGDTDYFKDVLQILINKLKPNQHLVLVSDFPKLDKNPVREYRSFVKTEKFMPQKITFPKIPTGVQELINSHEANVHFLDLKNAAFFKNAPYYNDTLMYYDESHINYYGSVHYAQFEGYKLGELIKKIKKIIL